MDAARWWAADSFSTARNIHPTRPPIRLIPIARGMNRRNPIEAVPQFNSETKLADIWAHAARRLGGVEALDFAREIVQRLECPGCGGREDIYRPAEKIHADQLHCRACGAESAAIFFHSIAAQSDCLGKTVRETGLPAWDILWARRGEQAIGFELDGDNPFARDGSEKLK